MRPLVVATNIYRMMMMVPAVATLLLILALLAGTEIAAGGGAGPTICDTANCGKGSCSEVSGPIPLVTTSYNCTCDPGWSQPRLLDIPPLPIAPCIIPDCHFDSSCFNLTLTLPKGIPITDPCVAINCGPGECNKGDGFSYSCDCHPGYVNLLNNTAFPCVKNCVFGMDCSRLGIAPPPPPSPSTTAPPPGNHDSSAPPPNGPKGPASSRRLLLLLLVSLAMVHLV